MKNKYNFITELFSKLVPLACIILIVLKVSGSVNCSWWWVFSPLWITFIIAFVLAFIGFLLIEWQTHRANMEDKSQNK